MKVYLVGGAVRDALLGQTIHDKDFVVVGAMPKTLLDCGFSQVGADFPVFLHPKTHHEYALARTERKSGYGHTGFAVDTAGVSLEDDLLRRDLTINAMALPVAGLFDDTITGDVIDPYGGKNDLKNKILRHVSPAFAEDPLRILRVARFYARFYELGFDVHDDTKILMQAIAERGELSYLSRERIWAESVKALEEIDGFAYFKLLFNLDILKHILPELSNCWCDDTIKEHTFIALKKAHQHPIHVKFALLISGFIHISQGMAYLDSTCQRLLTPKAISHFATLFITHYKDLINPSTLTPVSLLNLIEATKAQKDTTLLFDLIQTAQIISHHTCINQDFIRCVIDGYHTITINDVAKTLSGKQIGDELTRLRLDKFNQLICQKMLNYHEQTS